MDVGLALTVAGWFVQVIFDKLLTIELDNWASHVGLGPAVSSLSSELLLIKSVLGTARRAEIGSNEPLGVMVAKLRDLVRDAENLLDEIDYFRLQDLVEGTHSAASRANEAVRESVSALKRKFHIFSSQDVAAQEPGSSSAPRMALDIADMSHKIQDIVKQLQATVEPLRKALKLKHIVEGPAQSTVAANPRETSSFSSPRLKVFGRDQDKNDIVALLEGAASSSRTPSVFAIIGHGGFGKTTLARLVYNDPRIEGCFDLRIWVHVSASFDEVRLIREILQHVVSVDKHAGITNLNKLQETLRDGLKSKKFLLILDDMWEDKEESQWDRLVAPLSFEQVKGSAILVTTRMPTVAGMINAMNSIELGGLEESEFWSLFKACAFGDEEHEGDPHLQAIGLQIAEKLKGCPLAAKCIGAVLKNNLDHRHWTQILESNAWKFQQGTSYFIEVLRLSYDYLPFHLKQCFSYCALFPKGYMFNREELALVWMAQGFLHSKDNISTPEDVGSGYLNQLADWGLFQRHIDSNDEFSMHDLIHDLAQTVSSDECLTIDGSEPPDISQTVRHISIITSSAYSRGEYGDILRNEIFEQRLFKVEKLKMKNLSTLMLFGEYDSSFAEAFQNVFREANSMRLLRLLTMNNDVNYLSCNFDKLIHLRYLRLESGRLKFSWRDIKLPKALCKLYHLQVLSCTNICFNTVDLQRDFCNLISLRHFITYSEEHSMIAEVGKLTALQELKDFRVKKEKGFDIKQLRDLRQLGGSLHIGGLENLGTKEEASWAEVTGKKRLEELFLSWEDGGPEAGQTAEEEVLEGLQPHPQLKHLSITGYNGVKSPTWLDSRLSLTHLVSLHLINCKGWKALPPLGHLPFLKKLSLNGMSFVREVQILSLEELWLGELPELERLAGSEQHQTSSPLRVLRIWDCPKLTELPQYSDGAEEHWFPHLCRLEITKCPQLMHLPPLPHTQILSDVALHSVGSLPHLTFSKTCLGISDDEGLESLPEKLLFCSNLSGLQELHISNCRALTSVSWLHLRELMSLQKLDIFDCPNLRMPPIMLEKEQEDGKCHLLPSLRQLNIRNCNVTGKELSWLLQHPPPLSELSLNECPQITSLVLGVSANEANSSAVSDYLRTKPVVASIMQDGEASIMQDDEGRLYLPHLLLRSLLVFNVSDFPNLVSPGTKGFQDLVSLNRLHLTQCPMLLSSMLHSAQADDDSCLLPQSLESLEVDSVTDEVSPRMVSNLSSLAELVVHGSPSLTSLWLHPCKALRKLTIQFCGMLSCVNGLHSLVSLKELEVRRCPSFTAAWCHELQQQVQIVGSQELSLPLESLLIDDSSVLTASICSSLPSLESLTLWMDVEVVKLTEEQEQALLLLSSLRRLVFDNCHNLLSLPAELYRLSLKELYITRCIGIHSLPERGLPISLLKLDVAWCSKELSEQCEKIKNIRSVSIW